MMFEKLCPLARAKIAHKPILKHGQSGIMLKTDMPRTTREKEWYDSVVHFFYTKTNGQVNQLAIESYSCNIDLSVNNQFKIQKRFEQLTDDVLMVLFGRPLVINDGYFKQLGPYWRKIVRVPLKNYKYEPAKKLRLSRGLYKCDGRSGYGFRLDLFF